MPHSAADEQGRYYCDAWYKETPSAIAAKAKKWIDRVEQATGLRATIYTNPTAWWNSVLTPSEDAVLLPGRAVWTSRYTSAGPQYDTRWTSQGGSAQWKMAPLPRGASYPRDSYSIPHLWQFTETGYLPSSILTCAGRSEQRPLDIDWLPVDGAEYARLMDVAHN
jgi:GH25 family lysozyme M1 (1,4-beta-N-acetylmuramidase)